MGQCFSPPKWPLNSLPLSSILAALNMEFGVITLLLVALRTFAFLVLKYRYSFNDRLKNDLSTEDIDSSL